MIKPNASTEEHGSPFFLKNEKICREWEKFALDNGGQIEGSYNSWSYKVLLKIDNPDPVRIVVSRATYSNGALIFSSKYQNVHEQITIKTKVTSDSEFIVKKPSLKDFFTGKSLSRLKINNAYMILGKTNNKLMDKLSIVLSEQFELNKVLQIELKKNVLTISINHANEEFELIKSLVFSKLD